MNYRHILAAACFLLAARGAAADSAPVLALRGATVIDGTGAAPVGEATIVIKDGRITAIGRTADVRVPAGAHIVDLSGKYVIPGLMDANVHLDFGLEPEYLFTYEGRYDELVLESAQVALKSGVTTVFDTWGPRESLVKVRDAINAGQAVGSRVFVAGNIIGMGGPTTADFLEPLRGVTNSVVADRIDAAWEQGVGADLLWMTPEEVRQRVRTYIANGQLDFIKYLSSGHKEMQFIAFSPDAQKAIVEEGHRGGLLVQAHSTSPESLKLEIQAGVDLMTHCDISGREPIPESTIKLIVERRLPCSALFMTTDHVQWIADHAPPPFQAIIKAKDENDRHLIAAGAVILLSTDAGLMGPNAAKNPLLGATLGAKDLPTHLGDAHLLWLKAANERGMKPMDALLAATRNIAKAYGKAKDLGTLEIGKLADLVVLGADPLADPANYRQIIDVYKGGARVDRDALPSKRIMTPP